MSLVVARKPSGSNSPLAEASSRRRVAVERGHLVADVLGPAAASRDEPAAPPVLERHPVIHRRRPGRPGVGRRRRAEHQQTRHAQRVGIQMTAEARGDALKLRRGGGLLLQRVEDDARGGVLRGHFENFTVADIAEHDAVVEEERARIARIDQPGLQTGRREHEHLRFDRDVEGLERRLQISAAAVERETDRPVLQFLVDGNDRIVERRRSVFDGRCPRSIRGTSRRPLSAHERAHRRRDPRRHAPETEAERECDSETHGVTPNVACGARRGQAAKRTKG